MYYIDKADYLLGLENYIIDNKIIITDTEPVNFNKILVISNGRKLLLKDKRELDIAIEKRILTEKDAIKLYDYNKHKNWWVSVKFYKDIKTNKEFNYNKVKVYDTYMNKSKIVTYEELQINMLKGNVYGYNKFNIENNTLDDLFIYRKYMYYVYKNYVLIYNGVIAELHEIELLDNKFCNISLEQGKVIFYRYENKKNTKNNYIIAINTTKRTIRKELIMTKDEFKKNCRGLVCKYMLTS